jgi:hypothetical protein
MKTRGVLATIFITAAFGLTSYARTPQTPSKPAAPEIKPPANDDCLACHDDDSLKRGNGTPLTVHKAVFAASVHAPLACVDCHADLAKAELPHNEKLAKVDCAACHADQVADYKRSAHAGARANGSDVAANCVSCHGNHDIRSKTDPQSRTYHLNIAATCAACHGNQQVILKGHIAIGDVASPFNDSIHGKALSRSGLLVAPTCSDCHGPHDIRKKSDPQSKVAMMNVPGTCGKCHEGIAHQFAGSVHAAVLAKGGGAPACQTCHTAHAIHAADDPAWQIGVVTQCGTCHTDKIKTYRDTFHGQVTSLGFVRVATCAACHGAHTILPASDPRSMTSKARVLSTCQQCHADASASFAQYDPHADKHNRSRNPVLFFAAYGMKWLLVGTFAFFGLHAVLWFPRGFAERRRLHGRSKRVPEPQEPRT